MAALCANVSVPRGVSALLSPSTVLIKASGGRQQGWMDGLREGGRRDMHVWLPDLCDGGQEGGGRLKGAEN